MVPFHIGQKISGTVEKLVFGGSGLIRHQGIVVFVPNVIPDERVTVEITQVKARYAEGALVSIERPSQNRRAPLCPYSGHCGGCQLQHIDPTLHPSLKKEWLRAALHRELPEGLDFDVVPAQQVFGCRRKITLHALWEERQWVCGFFANDNLSLIPISWCPLFFTNDEKSFLQPIKEIIATIPGTPSAHVDLTLFRLPQGGFSLILTGTVHLSKESQQRLIHNFLSLPSVRTFSLRFPHVRYDSGSTEFTFNALNTLWHCSIEAFIQNNPSQSEMLWNDIINIVDATGPNQTILDLYSGIGVTAISLSRRGHTVTAVELSAAATRAAKLSAQAILGHEQTSVPHKERLKLIQSSVEKFLPTLKESSDWWIVNPPRTGLSKEVSLLMLTKPPKSILYVSCSPPTLARDLAIFNKNHWRVIWLKGYDMFPQTTHFETVAIIKKADPT
jgi:tRNA/tmRNA/rRNA uracil-C5-methylase (TrmA/RlmC/RlmD family)